MYTVVFEIYDIKYMIIGSRALSSYVKNFSPPLPPLGALAPAPVLRSWRAMCGNIDFRQSHLHIQAVGSCLSLPAI